MLIKRAPPFFCFVLGGIMLDAYWTWYSYHFAAACAASENSVPAPLFLFTATSLIPATGSLIFRNNRAYVFICLVACLSHIAFSGLLDDRGSTDRTGRRYQNCYRDVGASAAVSFAFAVMFSAAITATTLALGAIWLVQKWLYRPAATP